RFPIEPTKGEAARLRAQFGDLALRLREASLTDGASGELGTVLQVDERRRAAMDLEADHGGATAAADAALAGQGSASGAASLASSVNSDTVTGLGRRSTTAPQAQRLIHFVLPSRRGRPRTSKRCCLSAQARQSIGVQFFLRLSRVG